MSDVTDFGAKLPAGFQPERPAPSRRSSLHLTLIEGEPIPRSVAVSTSPLVLGRDPARAFHLNDPRISRSHCEVWLERSSVLVRDAGSTNGTFIDGERVTGQRLLPVGSVLQLGRYAFRLELLSAEEVSRREDLARDLERARRYLEGLLPPSLRDGALRTEWCFVPSAVLGGDALGYGELPDGRLALYVLDVCGHGAGSAMHAATVLNALRGRTLPAVDFAEPAQVLGRLNETFRMEDHGGMYFTIWYGVIDAARGRVSYASAGHPPALLLAPDGRIRERLAVRNPPIGIREGQVFAQAETAFGAAERLVVFSDGVFEIASADGREGSLEEFESRLVESAVARNDNRSDGSVNGAAVGGDSGTGGEARRLYDAACTDTGTTLEDDFTLLIVTAAGSGGP